MRSGRMERGRASRSPGGVRGARLLAILLLCGGARIAADPVSGNTADAWFSAARDAATASRHAEALTYVDSALAVEPDHYDARLLRAKIHSWTGEQDLAERELTALLAERPGDPDARFTLASLRYYQGRHAEAAALFRGLLKENPGNADAAAGLGRAEKALKAPSPRPWRAAAGAEYSTFTRRGQPAWNQQSLQLSRRFGEGGTSVHARAELYRQFELSDAAFEAGVGHAFSPRWNAALVAGWTAAPDFRPDWRVAVDAGFLALRRRQEVPSIPAAWLLAGYRHDAYAAVDVDGFHPGVRLEWREPWALTARVSRVRQGSGEALYGVSARVDGPVARLRAGPFTGLRFIAGAANAPETVRAATVSTRSVFAGLGAEAVSGWTFSMGYARDDREDSWVRHAVNAGVTRGF